MFPSFQRFFSYLLDWFFNVPNLSYCGWDRRTNDILYVQTIISIKKVGFVRSKYNKKILKDSILVNVGTTSNEKFRNLRLSIPTKKIFSCSKFYFSLSLSFLHSCSEKNCQRNVNRSFSLFEVPIILGAGNWNSFILGIRKIPGSSPLLDLTKTASSVVYKTQSCN